MSQNCTKSSVRRDLYFLVYFIAREIAFFVLQVEGVKAANVKSAVYDRAKRAATFSYTCTIGNETYMEEVTLYESIRADAHRTEY